MPEVRSFLAVELEEKIVNRIRPTLKALKMTRAQVRWVSEKNMHLTLKFLGDVQKGKLTGIITDKLGESLAHETPFELEISGLGAFPNPDHPRVIWVGTDRGSEKMKNLHRRIENTLADLGFQRERRDYVPHVTIGRRKGEKNQKQLISTLLSHRDREFGTLTVGEVVVMQSELTPRGPIYTPVSRIFLEKE